MGSHKASTSIGSVTFIGTTIPHGIAQNNGQKVVYTFDIKKLTNDEMILMYPTDPFTPGNDLVKVGSGYLNEKALPIKSSFRYLNYLICKNGLKIPFLHIENISI